MNVLYSSINKPGLTSHDWKLPFYFALILHFGLVVGGVYLPNILKAKPKFADIYTVSLINISEPAPAPPPAPQVKSPPPAAKAPPPKLKEVQNKKIAPIEEQVNTETPGKQEAISLKPLKKKIVKVKEKPKVDLAAQKRAEERRKRELAEQNRKQLAEALRREQLLAEQARIAEEALQQERNLLKSTSTPTTNSSSIQRQSSTGRTTNIGSSTDLISSQYFAAIINRLTQFWALPEYIQKNPTLVAIVVITIDQSGQIQHHFFEERSGDRVFDQFVSKAIESANPLPPIPPAMKKQRYEIGLRFRPGSIQ